MPVDVVLFDLDGTLVDSAAGIARAAARALARFDRPPLTAEQLRAFVGPPLRESFAGIGVTGDELDGLVDAYRHHYLEDGILDFEVYPGVVPLLDALGAAGLRLGVATSKRTASARRVLAHAGLAGRFAAVEGSEPDGSRPDKAAVIAGALGALDVDHPGRVVMVGDREHDALGARAVAVGFIGVAWGFAAPGELAGAGADRIAASPAALAGLVLGSAGPSPRISAT
jgi:phosphoglycolate phosphatase